MDRLLSCSLADVVGPGMDDRGAVEVVKVKPAANGSGGTTGPPKVRCLARLIALCPGFLSPAVAARALVASPAVSARSRAARPASHAPRPAGPSPSAAAVA